MTAAKTKLILILSSLALGACASEPAAAPPPSADASASAPAEAPEGAAAAAAPVTETVQVPAWTNEGKELEVAKLYEDTRLKIAAIALRRGTKLPVHEVGAKVSIHVLSGAGELSVGDSPIAVAPGSIVVLEPGAPHAMTPADDGLVVLLVHYDKG